MRDETKRKESLIDRLMKMSMWKLVLIGVIASEIFTFILSTLQTILWWPGSYKDLIIAGIIDALLVSAVVCAGLVYMIQKLRAEKDKVAAEQGKVDAISAGISEGLSIIDRDFTVVYQNDVARSLYGEHIGEHCYITYYGNVVNCRDCPVEKCFEDGGTHSITHTLQGEAGTRTLELTASPLVGRSGEVGACIEMVRDLTGC